MIRKAYFEDPAYVPLLLRSYELWRELERERNENVLRTTGVLLVGEESSEIISGSHRSAREHGLRIDVLGKPEINARYPTLRVNEGEVGVFEPDGGVLIPERAIDAHLNVAAARGAEMRFGVGLKNWRAMPDGFGILLADDTLISARVLVLALGPWFKVALERLGVPMRVQRNVQAWFSPRTEVYNAGRFPAFLVDRKGLPAPLYGFPDFGDGIKAAFHGFGDLTDAEHCDRGIDLGRDIVPLALLLEAWMPGAAGPLRETKTCMYSLTPDEHFVIDRHPDHENLILCGGFSGHGFKFAPVVGEIGAELALDGGTRHDIDFLALRRFFHAANDQPRAITQSARSRRTSPRLPAPS